MHSYFLHFVVSVACLLAFPAFTVAAESAPPRIAPFAVDAHREITEALINLIHVELSKDDRIHLVDRSEIKRVLDEHNLAASGFSMNREGFEIGKLLKADGFLFVSQGENGDTVTVRLIETVRGFQACSFVYPLHETGLDEIALSSTSMYSIVIPVKVFTTLLSEPLSRRLRRTEMLLV